MESVNRSELCVDLKHIDSKTTMISIENLNRQINFAFLGHFRFYLMNVLNWKIYSLEYGSFVENQTKERELV